MKLNKKFFEKAINEGFKIFLYANNKVVGSISKWWNGEITIYLRVGEFDAASKIEDFTKCSKFTCDFKEKTIKVMS